ncbi:tape measure protein [Paenarthrobacter sp. GOM3]|uniref:phage tail protein n=1 Tax=Paenarthrobacter sp. GOM3 TaxID=2782567 RepID=UPI001BA74E4B|nr:tape measure protein [Paenarthrobacter sp. GOM3]WOH20124.1 tape measure protein [Paenarthrobacter sp. GOM3]
MSEVGSGQVAIFPTFRGFRSSVNSEVAGAGREGGKTFSSAFSVGAGDPGAALAKKLNAQIASGAKALSAARLSEQDAAGKVRVAEAALNEARAKGEAGSARVLAVEERLATAKRKLTEASTRTAAASDQLRQSQAKLADATSAAGSAGEQSAGRFARGWQSLKQRLTGSAKSAVDSEGASARGSADKAGREAGNSFASSFKAGVGVLATALGAGMFSNFIAEAAQASDATDKFKATMDFAGLDTSAIADATAAAKEYADQTVFDLPTIQNTIAQLASNGVKDYTGLTKAAGNLNAVAGGNADTFKSVAMVMTQTAGAGKLTTENWNQMADAIPGAAGPLMKSLEEAGAYTGNFRDAMAAGQITSEEFNAALMKLGNDPVAVEAAKSTKTFEGAIGNLQATINSGLMGALDKMKPGITGAINLLSGGLGKAFEWTGKAATGLFDLFGKGDFTTNLREAFNVEEDSGFVAFLFTARDVALEVGRGFTAMFAAYKAGDGDVTSSGFPGFMERVGFVLREITGGVRAFFAAFKAGDGDVTSSGFPGFMEQVANTLRSVFDAVGPAIAALLPQLVTLWTAFSPLQLIFAAIQPLLPQLMGMFGQLATVISGTLVTALSTLMPVFMQLSGVIVQALGSVLATVLPVAIQLIMMLADTFGQLLPVLLPILTTIIELATSLISQLAPIITQLISAILPPLVSVFGNILAVIGPLIQTIASLLIPVIQALMPIVVTVFGVIVQIITAAMQIVQGIIEVVTGIITGNWAQVWSGILNIVGGVFNLIISVISGAIQLVISVVMNGLNAVVGFFTAAFSGIVNYVVTSFNSMVTGAQGMLTDLLGFFGGIGDNVLKALGNIGGLLLDSGKALIQGFIDGIMGMAGAIGDAVGGILGGVADFFPHSPAKRGPFSGSGYTTHSGKALADDFAKGITSGQQKVQAAANTIMGAASLTGTTSNTGAPAGAAATGWQGTGATVHVTMPIRDQMTPASVARAFDNQLNYKLRRERV